MSRRRWLECLFPEVQLLAVIRQEGLLRRGFRRPATFQAPGARSSKTEAPLYKAEVYTGPESGVAAQALRSPDRAPSRLTSAEGYTAGTPVNEALEAFRVSLMETASLYTPACEQLLALVARWNSGARPRERVAGSALVAGAAGSGKTFLIRALFEALKSRRLVGTDGFHELDLRQVSSSADLVDLLYEALTADGGATPRGVVVLDHLEGADRGVLALLQTCLDEGRLKYRTAELDLGSVFVCLLATTVTKTSGLPAALLDRLGRRFVGSVDETIVMRPPEISVLRGIAEARAGKFAESFRTRTKVEVVLQDAALQELAEIAGRSGMLGHGVITSLETRIQSPLSALFGAGKLCQGRVDVHFRGEFIALQENRRYALNPSAPAEAEGGPALAELENLVGMTSVKAFVHQLRSLATVQQERRARGLGRPQMLHMVFAGNPGTGKTTVARIVGRILREIGLLSEGHVIEVGREDLVAGYVGHTAPKVRALIDAALGGVLFIDEAYTLCRDEHDSFGREAIDALVKGMEDHRENLVVIAAGYTDEMDNFVRANPGLRSRFSQRIDFPDYTSTELLAIVERLATGDGFRVGEAARRIALKELVRRQVAGRRDIGNGRLARNLLEEAQRRQAVRLAQEPFEASGSDELLPEDFGEMGIRPFDLERELGDLVGLAPVKEMLRTLQKQVLADKRRHDAGVESRSGQSLNMIFQGNPGTGKTSVARVVGRLLKELGVLKTGQMVEVSRAELVAPYLGQTARETGRIIEKALGGVLFIDEAYSLTQGGDGFGQEAVNTLVKAMDDHRGDLIVILAGYTREMNEFIRSNPGLRSRFPLLTVFPDYTNEELAAIALSDITLRGFVATSELERQMASVIERQRVSSQPDQGNGRLVRNIVDAAIRKQSVRVQDDGLTEAAGLSTLGPDDFGVSTESVESPLVALERIVGLNEAKEFVRALYAQLMVDERRRAMGLVVPSRRTLHMVFKGNPGTGKTMMARVVASLLHRIGLLKSSRVVEVDRSGLVAGYVGQTALKTRERIEEALGGVLFVDEAYALAGQQDAASDFGKEALDTLVKAMEDYRSDLVVILAGYPEAMDRLLDMNPGLRSRCPNVLWFSDYSLDELIEIADALVEDRGLSMTLDARGQLRKVCSRAVGDPEAGNGRFVRNVIDAAERQQALRLSGLATSTLEDLRTLIASDFRE